MTTVLHLGAHKTATTYIQKALERSRAELAASGINYGPLEELRIELSPFLTSNRQRARDYLAKLMAAPGKTRILSDENFIGTPHQLVTTGRLYPNLEENLAVFQDTVPDLEIMFCIRSYETFWPSFYVEIIRHKDFISWENFLATFDLFVTGWPEVIDRLVALFGESRVTLWTYENFRQNEDRIFEAFTGGDMPLSKPPKALRQSPSAKAIDVIHKLDGILPPEDIRKLIWPLNQAFPRDEENPAFQPFDADVTSKLQQKYRDDIVAIRTAHPSLRWCSD